MTLKEAMLSLKKFNRPNWFGDKYSQYFLPKTGPHANLVDCDYFVHTECGFSEFCTSINLYPEEIAADDWMVFE